ANRKIATVVVEKQDDEVDRPRVEVRDGYCGLPSTPIYELRDHRISGENGYVSLWNLPARDLARSKLLIGSRHDAWISGNSGNRGVHARGDGHQPNEGDNFPVHFSSNSRLFRTVGILVDVTQSRPRPVTPLLFTLPSVVLLVRL